MATLLGDDKETGYLPMMANPPKPTGKFNVKKDFAVDPWTKQGYQNSLQYDPFRDVVKFGAYEFHRAELPYYKNASSLAGGRLSESLGAKSQTVRIDTNSIKNKTDIYKALGLPEEDIKTMTIGDRLYSTYSSGSYGGRSDAGLGALNPNFTQHNSMPSGPFRGTERWKNQAAELLYQELGLDQSKQRMQGTTGALNNTNNAVSGFAFNNLLPRNTFNVASRQLGDGTTEFAFYSDLPRDYGFVTGVSSMANALSATISGGDGAAQRPRRRTATGAF